MTQVVLLCILLVFVRGGEAGTKKNGEICKTAADCASGGYCSSYYVAAKNTHEKRCCSVYVYGPVPVNKLDKTNADCCGNSNCHSGKPSAELEADMTKPCPHGNPCSNIIIDVLKYGAAPSNCTHLVYNNFDGNSNILAIPRGGGCTNNKSCTTRRCFPSIDKKMFSGNQYNQMCCDIEDENDGPCDNGFGGKCCGDRDCKNHQCVLWPGDRPDGSRCNLDIQCGSKTCRPSPYRSLNPGGGDWKVCCSKITGQKCEVDANCCFDNFCVNKICKKRGCGQPCRMAKAVAEVWDEPDMCESSKYGPGRCGRIENGLNTCCNNPSGDVEDQDCSNGSCCCNRAHSCYLGFCSKQASDGGKCYLRFIVSGTDRTVCVGGSANGCGG